jgi:hypothetical protein
MKGDDEETTTTGIAEFIEAGTSIGVTSAEVPTSNQPTAAQMNEATRIDGPILRILLLGSTIRIIHDA